MHFPKKNFKEPIGILEVAKQCFYPFMAKEKYCQRNLF
jgi:hypothetical protein